MQKLPILLAHRGLHNKKNISLKEPFFKAIDKNLGIELDIRNHNNNLIVSHDLLINKPILYFRDICNYAMQKEYDGFIAINVKEDNLEELILPIIREFKIKNWFTFDHSIPDLISSKNLNSFFRISEFEKFTFEKYLKIKGCWLDSFNSPFWYDIDTLKELIKRTDLAIVSCDLHGFSPFQQWGIIEEILNERMNNKLFLCTDLIEEASNFFKIK